MYVFFCDVERSEPRKLELAEKCLVVCPTHRNGRLTLAALLLGIALTRMAQPSVFNRGEQVVRVAALIERAEKLYPQSSDLARAKQQFEKFNSR